MRKMEGLVRERNDRERRVPSRALLFSTDMSRLEALAHHAGAGFLDRSLLD